MEDRTMIHYAQSDENAREIYEMLTENNAPDPVKEMMKKALHEPTFRIFGRYMTRVRSAHS